MSILLARVGPGADCVCAARVVPELPRGRVGPGACRVCAARVVSELPRVVLVRGVRASPLRDCFAPSLGIWIAAACPECVSC